MKLNVPSLRRRSSSAGAFTLIELLVVIAIIAILAALILGVSGFVQEKAGRARAESEIQAISTALEAYKQDMGGYPESTGENDKETDPSTKVLLDALNPIDASGPLNTTGKVYFEVPLKMMNSNRSGQSFATTRQSANYLVDPFGNAYHYYFHAAEAAAGTPVANKVTGTQNNGPQFFDLWSYGKNPDKNKKIPDSWIKNW